ncbi:MAG: drug/metabolite transporter (DMT)-like permease [Verrucomicrobiales bacterium]
MAIFFGLLTALFFGSGDFFGGISAKRTSLLYVVAFSHLVGLLGALALAPFLADAFTWSDFAIGAVAGALGGVGVALLYRGLARGPMAVVAPLTAITSAAVPAIWGVAGGETLSAIAWVGVAVALMAIGLSSIPNTSDGTGVTKAVIGQSLLSGACFGSMFILLDATLDATAPWPIVGARTLTTAVLLTIIFTVKREGLPSIKPAIGTIALAGLFDTGSNVLFLFATTVGDLSIVAVLSSLYPAATVLLARIWLNERMSRLQLVGLVMALTATALIAAG